MCVSIAIRQKCIDLVEAAVQRTNLSMSLSTPLFVSLDSYSIAHHLIPIHSSKLNISKMSQSLYIPKATRITYAKQSTPAEAFQFKAGNV